ncbi:hypothetical protein PLICRDRAFT_177378 [Plicaturopsis crispa FD-325 SS-3]|nr:hypothetical protein PLICRDRAFT_177378 [Plicaturopsis crispa FD-325 SS-3]
MHGDLLLAPLETIHESLEPDFCDHITLHDLLDAYDTLCHRLKHALLSLADASITKTLEAHASQITDALNRDVRRVLTDPVPPPEDSLLTESVEMGPEELKYARDLTLVSHYAMRLTSDILRHHGLYSALSAVQIESLLHSVLSVLDMSEDLPTPDAAKTRKFALCILTSQRLPGTVLHPCTPALSDTVETILRSNNQDMAHDALLMIDGISQKNDAHFPGLIPAMLPFLIDSSASMQHATTQCLNSFALNSITLPATDAVSKHLNSFLKAHRKHPNLVAMTTLSTPAMPTLALLASLVVLAGPHLFTTAALLKLVFPALSHACVHKQRAVRRACVGVWLCIAWAYGRLCMAGENANNIREKAFLVVKQEVSGGIGVALVAIILGVGGDDCVEKALVVVGDMVRHAQDDIHRAGLALLCRLVTLASPQSPRSQGVKWDLNRIIPRALLDGRVLNGVKIDEQYVSTADVRALDDDEIKGHWEALVDMLALCGNRHLTERAQLSGALLRVWQCLLLVQAELTQGHQHLTTNPRIQQRVVQVVRGYLRFQVEQSVSMPTEELQLRRLTAATQLWGVMRNVYSVGWLQSSAKEMLRSLLCGRFDITNREGRVGKIWGQLANEIISGTGLHCVLGALAQPADANVEEQSYIWTVAAKSLSDSQEETGKDDLVAFLIIPFGRWDLSDYETELWESTLRLAISTAGSSAIPGTDIVERFAAQLSTEGAGTHVSPKVMLELLGYVDLSDKHEVPVHLVHILDGMLSDIDIISSTSASLAVPLHSALQCSLRLWIADEDETLSDDDYNSLVVPLYECVLSALRNVPVSTETLHAMSPILSAAFVRAPPPAHGPLAFEKFWRATYYCATEIEIEYPDSIKTCLRAFDDVYDRGLAAGLSIETDSQMTPSSVIPNSQPASEHRLDDFKDFGVFGPIRSSPPSSPTPLTRVRTRSAVQQPESHTSRSNNLSRNSGASNDGPLGITTKAASHGRSSVSGPRDTPTPISQAVQQDLTPKVARSVQLRGPLKRPSSDEGQEERSKRRKIVAETSSPGGPAPQASAIASGNPPSRPTNSRKRTIMDAVELPAVPKAPKRPRYANSNTDVPLSVRRSQRNGTSGVESHRSPPPGSLDDDYDDWEAGVTTPEMRRIQRELADSDALEVPETEFEPSSQEDLTSSQIVDSILDPALLLDSPGAGPSGQYRRSETMPPLSHSIAPPLRRVRTTSSRLERLQEAFALVTTDGSQMPVQDLLQATRLVHQIGAVLNEKMSNKLADKG